MPVYDGAHVNSNSASSSSDGPCCLVVLVLQDHRTHRHSKSGAVIRFLDSCAIPYLIIILLRSGLLCVEEKARPDHLPAHLPPLLHALDLVVGSLLRPRWVHINQINTGRLKMINGAGALVAARAMTSSCKHIFNLLTCTISSNVLCLAAA